MQRTFPRMLGEVGDPAIEQVGEEFEERPVRVQLADQVLHVGADSLAGDVGNKRVEVALVREVLEQAALGDSGTPGYDVQAAAGESVRTELSLGGFHHGGTASRIDTRPRHRRHGASLRW
ncbi:Uncharacterised protein [Mycobacterium tuberculosis]|uniref:Uncharacterized protein n=1 Tax=Mycobacterium tuberculosis TaxID=1773 RepID=A0A655AP17_MYCTX|nr:Uncharacterised protein [Mycobacterium tuberculosis]